jgi:hypothetical protein
MVSLMLGHNEFSGSVPEDLYQMPLVTYLDISSNKRVQVLGLLRGRGQDPRRAARRGVCRGRRRAPTILPPPPPPKHAHSHTPARRNPLRLEGDLNDGISLLIYLTDLDASGNKLGGAVGSGLFFLPQIARLNLANNDFAGTLDPNLGRGGYGRRPGPGREGTLGVRPRRAPGLETPRAACRSARRMCAPARLQLNPTLPQRPTPTPNSQPPPPPPARLAYNLRELVLANNSRLVGRLPDEAAGLAHLHRVGLVGTGMSCVPQELAEEAEGNGTAAAAAAGYRCAAGALLPCFLMFEDYTVPLSDESKMACRPIKRAPQGRIADECPPAALVSAPDRSEDVLAAQWDLPPAYYQYQGCVCLEGYVERWSRDGTMMQCAPDDRSALPVWTWVLVGVGAALLLLAASLVLLSSRLLLFRSRWLREAELKRKRRLGLPKAGDAVYAVVTDIEGYTGARGRAARAFRGRSRGSCFTCVGSALRAGQRSPTLFRTGRPGPPPRAGIGPASVRPGRRQRWPGAHSCGPARPGPGAALPPTRPAPAAPPSPLAAPQP